MKREPNHVSRNKKKEEEEAKRQQNLIGDGTTEHSVYSHSR